MRVCVTGGGGMIGGHLVGRLLGDGHDVVAVDTKLSGDWWQYHRDALNLAGYDMADRADAATAVVGCDEVYDLACPMGGIGWITTELYSCFSSLQIQMTTVKACIQANVGRYFYASSACVYNTDLQTGPIHLKESDAYPALPERGYGEAKLAGERLAEYAMKDRGMETRVARYHNVMGAPGSWSDGKEKAPAAICRKVAEAKKSGEFVIDIWGDGSQVRSYLDVRDCVAGTLTVMRSDYPQPLNVGSDRMVTVDQLVDMVEDIAGVTLERRYDRSAPKGVAGRNSDNTLVTKETGWAPRVKLEDALAELYGWVEAQVYG